MHHYRIVPTVPDLSRTDDVYPPALQVKSNVVFDVTDVHLCPLILEGNDARSNPFGSIILPSGVRYSDAVLRLITTVKNDRTETFNGTIQVNTLVGGMPSDTVMVELPTLKTRASITNEDEIKFHANQPNISMIPIGTEGAIIAVLNLVDKDTGESIGFAESNSIGWVV